jgi:DNA repair protein RecO (recombination protein O)
MLQKTRGIVFRFTKFGETSVIVNIFTEVYGLQSYIVNGVRSKSSKNKIALFQPLTLLDLVVYHRANAEINRIKEMKCLYPYRSVPVDVKKSTIAMFLIEVINKAVKEETHAFELCDFLIQSFITLDEMEFNAGNFHLIFLLKLSRFLGFGVHHVNDVLGARATSRENEEALGLLLRSGYTDAVHLDNQQRREILDLITKFYADHLDNMSDLKSVGILREIL